MNMAELAAWLGERFDKLEDKVDETRNHLARIDVTLASQAGQLAEHIRRTALLEAKLEPIEHHVTMVSGVLKFIGVIGAVVGLAASMHGLMK